jgi:hypothetical protein
VIIESSKSHYFAEDIYNDIQMDDRTFPTVEFSGYTYKNRNEQLIHIFN